VLVLEARNRLGGRIHTIRDPGSVLPIELGAEFVHGEAEETFAILDAARVIVDRLPDAHHWVHNGALEAVPEFWAKVATVGYDITKYLKRAGVRDCAFLQYLERSRWPARIRRFLLQYVEGYHAADPARISARFLAVGSEEVEEQAEPPQFRVLSGYDSVVRWLQAALDPEVAEVRLNHAVETVAWRKRDVAIHATSDAGGAPRLWRARTAIVTVPSAVLASGAIRFDPELPEKQRAAQRLEAGQVFKMVLRFREAFWAEDEFLQKRIKARHGEDRQLNFFHDGEAPVGTWWTHAPTRAATLTAWAGGPKAERLLDQTRSDQLDQVLAALSGALGMPRAQVDDLFDAEWLHDWRADRWSRSAYSYPAVGGVPAQKMLARPVGNALFFAGESTDAEETATVAGALGSGRRAARQVLSAIGKRFEPMERSS
jgi:monoamine oxidase